MKFYRALLIASLATTAITAFNSCSKKDGQKKCNASFTTPCEEDLTKTNIRIKNTSSSNYCDVTVIAADGRTVNYGAIKKGQTSCYNVYGEAYRYAYVKLHIDGEEYKLQPIDYVGETFLGAGKFTYAIGTDKVNRSVTIQTTEDD